MTPASACSYGKNRAKRGTVGLDKVSMHSMSVSSAGRGRGELARADDITMIHQHLRGALVPCSASREGGG